jgi:hypothetical protein
MTHPVDLVRRCLDLHEDGLSPTEIARLVDAPRSTVRDWVQGKVPRGRDGVGTACARCGAVHDLDRLPPAYVYLLGMYLGDGCLSEHPRDVYKLRISLDARYPGIASECERAIRAVMPRNRSRLSAFQAGRRRFPTRRAGRASSRSTGVAGSTSARLSWRTGSARWSLAGQPSSSAA